MPLRDHFKGKGDKVMREMKRRYGDERGERVFYATDNKHKQRGKRRSGKHRGR